MIPKIIHQIWIGDSEIPQFCLDYSKELQEKYSEYEFKIWKNKDLKEFPSCNFLEICKKNKYWDFCTDWYRTLILHKYGGIYLDFDIKYINKLPDTILNYNIILPIENFRMCVSNYIIGSSKNNRFTSKLISIYKSYTDEEFDKPTWSAPEVYRNCVLDTFGRYSVLHNETGKYTNKNRYINFIEMDKSEYFEHKIGTIYLESLKNG